MRGMLSTLCRETCGNELAAGGFGATTGLEKNDRRCDPEAPDAPRREMRRSDPEAPDADWAVVIGCRA
jgi:hypothetical protein